MLKKHLFIPVILLIISVYLIMFEEHYPYLFDPTWKRWFDKPYDDSEKERLLIIVFGTIWLPYLFYLSQYLINYCSNKREDYLKIERYKTLAKKGDAEFQFRLALAYESGRILEKDYTLAAEWLLRSAEQGYPPAQHNLGLCYKDGHGLQKDYIKSYMWLTVASEHFTSKIFSIKNFDPAFSIEQRNFIAVEMSSEQILEAEKLAKKWIKKDHSMT